MLRTFRLPGVTSANVAALLQFSAVIPVFFFVTLHLQEVQRYSLREVQRYSALRAGLAFLPLAGGVIVIALSASWLVGRFGPAPTLIADPLVFAGRPGLSQLPAGARTYVADVLPGLVMVAAGAGLVNTMQRVGSSWGLRADRHRHCPHQGSWPPPTPAPGRWPLQGTRSPPWSAATTGHP